MKIIILSKGEECFVDDDDYIKLSQYKWTSNPKQSGVYAYRYERYGPRKEGKKKSIPMHRDILKPLKGQYVDHINGNTLDNRKENLRICSSIENAQNSKKQKNACSSKYKGVCWDVSKNKWSVYVTANRKTHFVGRYKTEKEAALAYNNAAKLYHADFAKLNNIED